MSLLALVTLITTAGIGLYLLSIWLIEYDKEFQTAAATRLPVPLLTSHVLIALGGLALWVTYLIVDNDRLVLYSLAALAVAASLGVTMAVRWAGVYRAKRASEQLGALALTAPATVPSGAAAVRAAYLGPPERNFPLPVVIAHGMFAAATLTLVLLTALGVGGS
jgi:hypothetical protein